MTCRKLTDDGKLSSNLPARGASVQLWSCSHQAMSCYFYSYFDCIVGKNEFKYAKL